jgi:hypothetical protein
MAENEITDYLEADNSNIDIAGISVQENVMRPPAVNNAFRALQGALARVNSLSTLASASTVNLGSVASQAVSITGTVSVTSFGTVKAGTVKLVKLPAGLTIVYNATSMILPGSADILAEANDSALMLSLGSGNWQCLLYSRFSTPPSGALPIANGGTGATTASAARDALGLKIGTNVQAYSANAAFLNVAQAWSAIQTFNAITIHNTGELFKITGEDDLGGGVDGFMIDQTLGYANRHTRASTTTRPIHQFYNANGMVGNISTSGSGTSYSTTSDGRLKVNQVRLSDEIDVGSMIDALQPKAYDFLSSATMLRTGERAVGLVAQEVETVLPSAVSRGDGEPGSAEFTPWSLDYTKFVPILIAEVQQLRSRLAAVESGA